MIRVPPHVYRAGLPVLLGALLTGWLAAHPTVAAPPLQDAAPACFVETGYCIGGRIREVWERGGGLLVFGFPITGLQEELVEGQPRLVQWFERARIELHPANPPPYDVLIGRVGAEVLGHEGGLSRAIAATAMPGECWQAAETGVSICGAFLAAWRAGGTDLDGDGLVSEAESLALYGLPLTPPRTERLADGQAHVVQWFERARFELHPQIAEDLVLRGLLGRELAPVAVDPPGSVRVAPGPPPSPAALAAAPTRLRIPAIGLVQAPVPVGTDASGAFVVPDHEVGWYNGSAAPGQGENIVLWGHVLPFLAAPHLPAPFARLEHLGIGAQVVLYDSLGQPHEYVVTQQFRVAPEQIEYVFHQGRELVTMVSCIGEGIVAGGGIVDYSERLITIAEPR